MIYRHASRIAPPPPAYHSIPSRRNDMTKKKKTTARKTAQKMPMKTNRRPPRVRKLRKPAPPMNNHGKKKERAKKKKALREIYRERTDEPKENLHLSLPFFSSLHRFPIIIKKSQPIFYIRKGQPNSWTPQLYICRQNEQKDAQGNME